MMENFYHNPPTNVMLTYVRNCSNDLDANDFLNEVSKYLRNKCYSFCMKGQHFDKFSKSTEQLDTDKIKMEGT